MDIYISFYWGVNSPIANLFQMCIPPSLQGVKYHKLLFVPSSPNLDYKHRIHKSPLSCLSPTLFFPEFINLLNLFELKYTFQNSRFIHLATTYCYFPKFTGLPKLRVTPPLPAGSRPSPTRATAPNLAEFALREFSGDHVNTEFSCRPYWATTLIPNFLVTPPPLIA